MLNLQYPATDIGDPFALLSTALGTPLPADMERDLRRLYRRYWLKAGTACKMKRSTAFRVTYGKTVKAAYKTTYEGKSLHWVRAKLLAAARNRCPSCGGPNPTELDHHLPQKSFAEFALFPLNLIPMCGPCNKRKSASSETDINKAFIHPYLDTIPAVTFYDPTVTRSDGTYNVTFQFVPSAIADAVLAKRMAFQIKRIKLNNRLSSEVTEVLNEFALTIRDEIVEPNGGVIDSAMISAMLLKRAERIEELHRVGFWQAVMARALASDATFCSGGFQDLLPRAPVTVGH